MGCRSVVSTIFRSERTDIGNFVAFAHVDLVVVMWVVGPIAIAVLVGDGSTSWEACGNRGWDELIVIC